MYLVRKFTVGTSIRGPKMVILWPKVLKHLVHVVQQTFGSKHYRERIYFIKYILFTWIQWNNKFVPWIEWFTWGSANIVLHFFIKNTITKWRNSNCSRVDFYIQNSFPFLKVIWMLQNIASLPISLWLF